MTFSEEESQMERLEALLGGCVWPHPGLNGRWAEVKGGRIRDQWPLVQ